MGEYRSIYETYRPYINFIKRYRVVSNASTGSKFDSNANVENKNVTTLTGELPKELFIGINRLQMGDKLLELYGEDISEEYLRQLDKHEIYKHDETNPELPYCVSITMYPFLFNGMKEIGGISTAPKNLQSFCGSFVNLVFAIAAQFAGAVSTPEFLTYMDYFIRLEYGDDYYKHPNKQGDCSKKQRSIDDVITQYFQEIVYSLNQPAAARNYQCVREDTTQLWTPNGFKYLSELKEGDLCYVWKDGKFEIEPIKHLNVYDIDDDLIQFCGNNYQQTVTKNHRVVYKKTDGSGKYDIKEAKDLVGHSKLSLPICGDNDFDDYPMSDDMLRACTYALTDGSLTKPSDDSHIHAHTTLKYYMSPNRKGYQEVIDSLTNLGIGFTVTESKCNEFGVVNIINVPPVEASSICNAIENSKKKMPNFYKVLSQRQAKLVLDCWSKSDGQKLRSKEENTRLKLQCDNMEIADTLQHVCMLAGVGSTISVEPCKSVNDEGKQKNTIYVNTFSRDSKRITKYNTIHYKGRVWCPSTDAGVVVFREENNTPYISGNSVFWNIAYFDKAYFNNIFENFVFPDGSAPQYESVVWLQKRFMSWFNQERLRTILTFPVETANSLIIENEDGSIGFDDEDFADYIAEMWSKGHSFFWYNSDSVDSLASCCFDGSQKIKCRDKNGEYECSFKELSEMDIDNDTLEVPIYQKWAKCKLITLPKRQMYKILIGEHEVICTDNHLFPVGKSDSFECIDKEAKDIQVGNKIPVYDFNTKTSIGVEVTSIEKCDGTSSMVYCFEMENQDNPYFMLANGVITHNCRLRNELQDNTFSYTLGAGGVSTGSKCVITINFNRLVQDVYKKPEEYSQDTNHQKLDEAIRAQVKKIHKYLIAYNAILEDSLNANLMSVYNAGYISMNKQFLTIGINGLVEGAEYLGIDINPNDDYFNYCTACLKPIYEENKKAKTKEIMFNTEYVPAENLGVKNAKWDKEDGYFSPRDCYNSYFYRPEDNSLSIIDKLILHGKKTTQWLDGGSALHMNLEEHLTKEQYKKIMLDAAKVGCSYLTFNVPNTVCKDCGYISKHKFDRCPQCGSENVDWATRIIGYLKLISKFSEQRQIEANKRYYINATEQITT